jgi:hypothetical protein
MLYAPQAGKTNRFRTKRPIYQDANRAAQEIHGRLDQPATRQAPVVDWLECSDLGDDEPRTLGHHAVLEEFHQICGRYGYLAALGTAGFISWSPCLQG